MSGPGFELLGSAEERNLLQALRSGTLTRYRFGKEIAESFVYRLERAVEARMAAGHCIAVNSGTSALLTGLAALGIGAGDEVIVPGYAFVASYASIVYAGATPVVAEIDETLGLSATDVASRITPRTKAVMPVHMLGAPTDMAPLMDVAREHGLLVLEDVAQACGGTYRGRHLGTIGDGGAFSMNYFKVITSGEGGFFVCDSTEAFERGYAFHDHGFKPFRDGVVEDDALFGLNLRMSDLTGAVAAAQFDRLDEVLARSRAVRASLAEQIGDVPGAMPRRVPDDDGDCGSTLVYIFDDAAVAAKVAAGLGTVPLIDSGRHYYGNIPQLAPRSSPAGPCPFQPWRPVSGLRRGALPRTDDILSRSIALSTGTSDHYAGTGFGVSVTSDEQTVSRVARTFRAVVAEVVGS
jgi:dTDP-4-amino-4,6-dideoxygalactose transaminase